MSDFDPKPDPRFEPGPYKGTRTPALAPKPTHGQAPEDSSTSKGNVSLDTPPSIPGTRVLGWIALALILLAIGGGVKARRELEKSLPRLTGDVVFAGLTAEVTVSRDELGVPTIDAQSRDDAAAALGFLHAQDRFFQMDLSRRKSAGELSGLVGRAALELDQHHRVHRFRSRAQGILSRLEPKEKSLLKAYTAGVAAGLKDLGRPPFEYTLLQAEPEPWRPEDTLLVAFTMYFELNDEDGAREDTNGVLLEALGPDFFRFLAPQATQWDAPLDGSTLPTAADVRLDGLRLDAVPSPTDPPAASAPHSEASREQASYPEFPDLIAWLSPPEKRQVLGSNNFALAGSRTKDGRALLANDMHLNHSVPTIWYRVRLRYSSAAAGPNPSAETRDVTGVTLAGSPFVIVGTNRNVAWAFTNAYGDWTDLVIIDQSSDGLTYKDQGQEVPFDVFEERIKIKGEADEIFEVRETRWGPVIDLDHHNRPRSLRWTAHDPGAVNFGFLDLESADTLEEALDVANRTAAPPQNFVAADRSGRIGWTLLGLIPNRFGHSGRTPASWADGTKGWQGYRSPSETPRIIDPPSGQLWTANQRTVGAEALAVVGDGGFDLGARAFQIKRRLDTLNSATEADLLSIQLDTEAHFLARWHELAQEALLETSQTSSSREEMRDILASWEGQATTTSVSYRLVHEFRNKVRDLVFNHLTKACKGLDQDFSYDWVAQSEGPLWQLVTQQPQHLLPSRFDSWQGLLLHALDAVEQELTSDGARLSQKTWGHKQMIQFNHPLASKIPVIGPLLNMTKQPLPGDAFTPRVQTETYGASQRLVVSPGHEELGYFHMPAGQSGHPLSPHYRNGHEAWVKGSPTPFLPGAVSHQLTLKPERLNTASAREHQD